MIAVHTRDLRSKHQKPVLSAQIDGFHDLARGLTGYWPFQEGIGAVANISKTQNLIGNNRFPGTFTGTGGIAPAWAAGRDGLVLSFPGTNAARISLSVALSNFLLAAEGSIIAQAMPTGAPVDAAVSYTLPNVFAENAGYLALNRGTISGGADSWWAYNWDVNEDRVGVPISGQNVWDIIGWGHGGGVLYVYKNGALGGSTASGNTGSLAGIAGIGGYYSASFTGAIAWLAIYNRLLSPGEFAWLAMEPYAFILPQAPQRRYFLPGGLSIPVAMADYRRRRVA